MAKKPQVDIRKLKDEVAEHLKKSRWEKAAEVLAELAAAEPKDMTLRLKLGDTYRKMDQPQMAIEAYRHAAKFFGDEGQLIKAIGAAKIILEIDPRNAEALKQLGDMNKRRIGKISLARIPAPTNHPAAAGRRQGAIELGDSPGTLTDLGMTTGIDLPAGGEDEPLELDDGRSIRSPACSPAARRRRSSCSRSARTRSWPAAGPPSRPASPPRTTIWIAHSATSRRPQALRRRRSPRRRFRCSTIFHRTLSSPSSTGLATTGTFRVTSSSGRAIPDAASSSSSKAGCACTRPAPKARRSPSRTSARARSSGRWPCFPGRPGLRTSSPRRRARSSK